jgi:hypothetical protein
VKPVPSGAITAPSDIDGWVQLGRQIRSAQDVRPPEERIYIGGEFWMAMLANRTIGISRILRFEDFEELWLTMNDTVSKVNS